MIRSTIVDNHWSTLSVQEIPDRGRPYVRAAMPDEDTKRFRVTFLVFGPTLNGKDQVTMVYYGLDFKDCRHKMQLDTDGAVFKVIDVVDLQKNWHNESVN